MHSSCPQEITIGYGEAERNESKERVFSATYRSPILKVIGHHMGFLVFMLNPYKKEINIALLSLTSVKSQLVDLLAGADQYKFSLLGCLLDSLIP